MGYTDNTLYDALFILDKMGGEMTAVGEHPLFEPHAIGPYITKIFSPDVNKEIYRMTEAGRGKLNELENKNA